MPATTPPDRRPDRDRRRGRRRRSSRSGAPAARTGGMQEDIGGVSMPVVRPVLGFKAQDHVDRPVGSAVPSNSAMTRWPRCASRCPMWSGTPRRTRGTCISRGGHDRQGLTIQVEDNGVGIDPYVTPGGRNTAARARASGGHATVVRRSSRGPLSPGWHSRLRESRSRSPSCRGQTLQSAPNFPAGRPRAY
jgi:hypothetical protein